MVGLYRLRKVVDKMTVTKKVCGECKRELPLTEFELAGSGVDGRYYMCRACESTAWQRTKIPREPFLKTLGDAAEYIRIAMRGGGKDGS